VSSVIFPILRGNARGPTGAGTTNLIFLRHMNELQGINPPILTSSIVSPSPISRRSTSQRKGWRRYGPVMPGSKDWPVLLGLREVCAAARVRILLGLETPASDIDLVVYGVGVVPRPVP